MYYLQNENEESKTEIYLCNILKNYCLAERTCNIF